MGSWFETRSAAFKPLTRPLPDNFRFPLGRPIVLGYVGGLALEEQFSKVAGADTLCGSEIWITPAGGVYIILSCERSANGGGLPRFPTPGYRAIYDVACFLFLELFEELTRCLKALQVRFLFAGSVFLDRNKMTIDATRHLRREASAKRADIQGLHEMAIADFRIDDLLIDVYYIETDATAPERNYRIGYGEAFVAGPREEDVFAILLVYLSFPAAVWLLGAASDYANRSILHTQDHVSAARLSSVRSLKIFCDTLVAETQPIQIRITEYYLELMDATFKALKLETMYAQVNALMSALSGEAAAIEAQLQVVRDRKIAAGGVSIALIAALSAGYDLIQFSREVSPATLAFWTLPFGVIALSIVLLGLMIAPVRRARNDRLSLF
jgi:hypothetical protein